MNLAVLDCETTGLAPGKDRLLEVGVVVVSLELDRFFEEVAAEQWDFHFDLKKEVAAGHYIHPKVIEMHNENGLWRDCERSQLNDYQKMDLLVSQFIVDNGAQKCELAGANPSFDRGFLNSILPVTAQTFHYRNFDTNSFWLLRRYLTGEQRGPKPCKHRAIDDCRDAIRAVEEHINFIKAL